ncbi:hypothetical protein QYE76_052740 [Lolium multiflorum]|uniref:Uncharacterized protein n=1 Tax=Lolium multiflorum TaxID=4521 RepID=A0AAD8SVX6_LOLMU|nr:hypothetical protein QYE76_052740 [Lolium multiflorum]
MRSTNLFPAAYKYPPFTPFTPFAPFSAPHSAPPHRNPPEFRRSFAGVVSPPRIVLRVLKFGEPPQRNLAAGHSNHRGSHSGHLRVTPELSLFQFYFLVKKEKVAQTSTLATCGGVTFKLRPGRVYPHMDRNESVRYWSGKFFYLKDVADPASPKVLPEFKDGPPARFRLEPLPSLSESPQLTRAVRRICSDGGGSVGEGPYPVIPVPSTSGPPAKRIQPLQHRDRLLFQYTGRDDSMRASKDNLSADALDKRLRVLIKVQRDLRIHVCNMDIHINGSGTAVSFPLSHLSVLFITCEICLSAGCVAHLEALEDKDLGTLTRVPHSGNTDPEVASDPEAPVDPAPSKRKRGASSGSGPTAKRARDVLSTAATRKAEAEKKRLNLIDTSNKNQPNIHQFFRTSTKNPGTKPPKNPKKKSKPSPATMPVTTQAEAPPKPSSSTAADPKDVINLDDLPEDPTTESGHGGPGKGDSGKYGSSSHPPPEHQDTTSAEATAHDAENKLPLSGATGTPQTHPHMFPVIPRISLSQRHAEMTRLMNEVWGEPDPEESTLAKLEGEINLFFAQHKHVRQNTRKLHEDLRVHVLEQKTEIDGLRQSYADSQKAITLLETRIKNYEEEIAKRPTIDALSAKVEVLEAENESLKNSLRNPPRKNPRRGRKDTAANPISGIQEIASGTLPERGIITGGLYITMPASGLMRE